MNRLRTTVTWVSAAIALGAIAAWPLYVTERRRCRARRGAADARAGHRRLSRTATRSSRSGSGPRGEHRRGDMLSPVHLSAAVHAALSRARRHRRRHARASTRRRPRCARSRTATSPPKSRWARRSLRCTASTTRSRSPSISSESIRATPRCSIREASVDSRARAATTRAGRIVDRLRRAVANARRTATPRSTADTLIDALRRADRTPGARARALRAHGRVRERAVRVRRAAARVVLRAGRRARVRSRRQRRRARRRAPRARRSFRATPRRTGCWRGSRCALHALARVPRRGARVGARRAVPRGARLPGRRAARARRRASRRADRRSDPHDRARSAMRSTSPTGCWRSTIRSTASDLGDAYRIATARARGAGRHLHRRHAGVGRRDGRPLGRGARAHPPTALRFDTENALLQYHAGSIALHFGDRSEAKRRLERALALNPQFHPFYADDARKQLGRSLSAARSGRGRPRRPPPCGGEFSTP